VAEFGHPWLLSTTDRRVPSEREEREDREELMRENRELSQPASKGFSSRTRFNLPTPVGSQGRLFHQSLSSFIAASISKCS
jgi:hypothetical protein